MQAKTDILVCRKILTTRISKSKWEQHVHFREAGLLQRQLSLTVEWWELVSHKWHPEESANRGQLLIKHHITSKPDGPNDYCYVTQKPLLQDISRFWLSTTGHPNLAPVSRVPEVTFNINVWQKGTLTLFLLFSVLVMAWCNLIGVLRHLTRLLLYFWAMRFVNVNHPIFFSDLLE